MVVRFLRDFQSAATGENFYVAGTVADLPRGAEIVAEGAAEIVTIDSRRGQVEPRVSSEEETQDAPRRVRPARQAP